MVGWGCSGGGSTGCTKEAPDTGGESGWILENEWELAGSGGVQMLKAEGACEQDSGAFKDQ